jgi:hypothetical protein
VASPVTAAARYPVLEKRASPAAQQCGGSPSQLLLPAPTRCVHAQLEEM